MARLFQHWPAPADPRHPAPGPAHMQHEYEEDIPLGWECANPALQFDTWEPVTEVSNPFG